MVRQFQQVIALGPTLAADHTFNFIAPFNCTLVHVSLCNSTANAGTFDIGTAADPDGWMDGKAFGVSGTPLEYDAISDFDGAVFPGRLRHSPGLIDVVCQRLLAEDVLPFLHAVHGRHGMKMVGR